MVLPQPRLISDAAVLGTTCTQTASGAGSSGWGLCVCVGGGGGKGGGAEGMLQVGNKMQCRCGTPGRNVAQTGDTKGAKELPMFPVST